MQPEGVDYEVDRMQSSYEKISLLKWILPPPTELMDKL